MIFQTGNMFFSYYTFHLQFYRQVLSQQLIKVFLGIKKRNTLSSMKTIQHCNAIFHFHLSNCPHCTNENDNNVIMMKKKN